MNKWTKKIPGKEGLYFFYGWPYGVKESINNKKIAPELSFVKVYKISNGLITARDGNFWWPKKENAIGVFTEIDMPDLPNIENIK